MPGLNLTRDEAVERASHLTAQSYSIELDVTTSERTFGSRTTTRFDSTRPGTSTFVDLVAETVHEIVLNGTPLDPVTAFDGARISLPEVAEHNELVITADCFFMNTGEGLHRFVDPVDGEVYLYSQFEVADSRRVFAVFEQPDLKSTFTLTLTAPAHWEVFSASPTPEPTTVRDGVRRWAFSPTPPLSSYVMSIVGGPYSGDRDRYEAADGRVVPLGVFCRRSLRPHLDSVDLFAVTRQGFDFFEELFGRPYPFEKYDQVFVPEFNAGAMENAGCVTLLDDYVFRSKVPEAVVERRAETVLHELAHMWFGDLVTMLWWDDLWLNESFATYASVLCQADATRWPDAWTTFANIEKTWAYRQDQLPSTHPIVADIRDLEDVEVNFDGITYAKGASVLKQLVAWVGREQFFEGIRNYFTAHAWGNATLSDLLRELESTSGRDLHAWSKEWLETAGVNTLRPDYTCDSDGRFTSFAVVQTAPNAHDVLRSHRLGVGLFDRSADGGPLERVDWLEVSIAGARTDVPELVGRPCPALVLVNDRDLAYAKIRLDEASLQTVVHGIADISDQLPRALCWAASWDMMRDAEMSPADYITLALSGLGAESDSSMIRSLLRQLETAAVLFTPPDDRDGELQRLATGLLAHLRATTPGSDAQLQFARSFAGVARSPEHLTIVQKLLDGSEPFDGLAIDTDLRWHLLHCLVARGVLGSLEIETQLAADNTATGHRYAAAARAARPTAEAKAAAWASVVEHDDLPNAHQAAVMNGFSQPDQLHLVREYRDKYFASLETVWASRTNEMAQNIVVGFYPSLLNDSETLAMSDAWLSGHPDAPPALRRLVLEARDGVARSIRAHALSAAAT